MRERQTNMSTEKTYQIALKNCAFYGFHGALAEETKLGQRFYVDCFLDVDWSDALTTDELDDTVHYGRVFHMIENIVTGQPRHLIETLALDIAKHICDRYPMVAKATITIRKPSAPVAGTLDHVEVTVSHSDRDV